ncbi:hypothetical protein MTBBW1_820019 [Desulfamplus magnetovallimortis]|uniref:Uncharacterized protein n=1 Tax=Desulfamplus magnetovallimortis TaxID=1246637 RepID=A0A1W1HK82_9BACT|nr:hypothetical protein MTBBW1_820019 [Desulfamplus magnetovallimortis]
MILLFFQIKSRMAFHEALTIKSESARKGNIMSAKFFLSTSTVNNEYTSGKINIDKILRNIQKIGFKPCANSQRGFDDSPYHQLELQLIPL